MSNKRCSFLVLAAIVMLAGAQSVWAVDGQWDGGAGNWGTAADPPWFGGIVASGASADADFNIYANSDGGQTITNDLDPTIGKMEFGNHMGTAAGWWNLDSGTITMDNGASNPLITAHVFVTINSALAGNKGVEFAGDPWNVVTLSNTNNYTGGMTLSSPTVSISSLNNIGGAASQITFNSGTLQVTGTAVNNLNTNTVNWASFNGGIDVAASGNTFSINNNIAGGINLWKKGPGSLNMNADSNFSGNVKCDGGGNINLAGNVTLTSGNSLNVATDGSLTTGTLNVGTVATDNATVNANRGLNLGGGVGAGGNGTVNVHGTSIVNVTTFGSNEIDLGVNGNGTGTINMYDHSILNAGTLLLAKTDDAHSDLTRGYVNLYNHATVNTNSFVIASKSDPRIVGNESIVTLNNDSKIITTDMKVGDQGNAVLTINDNAQVNVSGTLSSSVYAFWAPPNYSSAYGNTAEIDVNYSGQINAAVISMEGNWNATNCVTTMKVTDNAKVTTVGDFMAAKATSAIANISINKNAQVNVGGMLTLGGTQVGNATLNLSCNPGETASLTAGWLFLGGINPGDGWAWTSGTLNVSGKATATVTNDVIIGQGFNADGKIKVSGDSSLAIGGTLTLSLADSATASLTVLENANFSVGGATALANGSIITLDSTGVQSLKAVYGNGNLVVGDSNSGATHYLAKATADSVSVSTLTIGSGSTLTINAIPGGPMAGGGFTAVPEPSTFAMLAMAALGLMAAAWRRRK